MSASSDAAAPLTGRVRVPAGARLVLATHNAGKLAELRQILTPLVPGLVPESVISAASLQAPEPVEDGLSFADNALLKARALARATGLPAVADDSGLCVDVLGGAPGIFSARWSGRHGDDTANLQMLPDQLGDVVDPRRSWSSRPPAGRRSRSPPSSAPWRGDWSTLLRARGASATTRSSCPSRRMHRAVGAAPPPR